MFTAKLVLAIERAGLQRRATIQSFDWRTIQLARRLDRRIDTVALVWRYGPAECRSLADECSLQAVYGDPTVTSPWTGGLDWWRYRDLGKLVQVHDPVQPKLPSADWYLRQDPAYFHGPTIPVLHQRYGLKVIPYTLDDGRPCNARSISASTASSATIPTCSSSSPGATACADSDTRQRSVRSTPHGPSGCL